jgi:septal ring factor EnvC (AmiA/AmiB activator)
MKMNNKDKLKQRISDIEDEMDCLEEELRDYQRELDMCYKKLDKLEESDGN